MLKRRAPSIRSTFVVRLCLALGVLACAVALLHTIAQTGFTAARFRLASGGGPAGGTSSGGQVSKLILRSGPTEAGGNTAQPARVHVVAARARPVRTPPRAHTLARVAARSTAFTPATTQPAPPAPRAPADSRTVLYIEDNPSNIKLVEAILAARPEVTLIVATQGSLAIDLAREHRPALVLLDLNLPDISGEEVLRRLRSDARTTEIPV
ncbi:MAG: hypothetical protein QOH16_1822, partial [Gaiellaceae bacterium]|nr:hypothetical protein [Gaiellaceae bacterium]